MQEVTRTVDRYDVWQDAASRWPDWSLYLTDLAGIPELFVPSMKRIFIDVSAGGDVERARAHAIAHLDLHLSQLSRGLLPEQEAEADALADVRLDREGSRPM